MPNGLILFEGPSQLDGSPIVCIATGIDHPSANHKTGPMVQTWILRRDVPPDEAAMDGSDSAVCGACPLRGVVTKLPNGELVNRFRSCYVFVGQAPTAVWRAYKRGDHGPFEPSKLAGRFIRFGAYGDPCAVPLSLWRDIAAVAAGHTGYTHQWRDRAFQWYRSLLMASVETEEDAALARLNGWRTFRAAVHGSIPMAGEFHCPASKEQGYRLTCEECGACDGTGANPARASVVIWPHGPRAAVKSFYRLTRGASKAIDHRAALNAADVAALDALRTAGRLSAAALGKLIGRGAQATATRLWHMRQMGVVRRVGRGQYEATEGSNA